MWAVFVNVFTVAVGSVVGLLARNLISKKLFKQQTKFL